MIATAIGLSVNMSNDQRRQIVAKDYKNILVFLKCVTDICVRVCVSVCAQISLSNKYKNLNIRSGQEMRLSSSDPFSPPRVGAGARSTAV